jgi:hypothetical protein
MTPPATAKEKWGQGKQDDQAREKNSKESFYLTAKEAK